MACLGHAFAGSMGVDTVVHAVVACDQSGAFCGCPTQNLAGEVFVEVSDPTDYEVARIDDYF